MATKTQKTLDEFTKSWETRQSTNRPDVVRVSWLDACIRQSGQFYVEPGWRENYNPGTYMETVGYLLFADKDWVTVAMERQGENSAVYREVQDIPRYSIAEFQVLKVGGKLQKR